MECAVVNAWALKSVYIMSKCIIHKHRPNAKYVEKNWFQKSFRSTTKKNQKYADLIQHNQSLIAEYLFDLKAGSRIENY